MFKVVCNGNTLHDDSLASLRISNATVELELGKTGSFNFTIFTSHPYYESVEVMTSRISVYRNEAVIFSGRVFKIEYGFHNEKQVFCEGELAFLLDTIMPPIAFYGSFNEYFERIVQIHNSQVDSSKQFTAGAVTVGEFYPYEVVTSEYSRTWDELQSKVVERSGGYLQARYENGIRYLDVLSFDANISNVSSQTISFGKNLIDIKRDVDGTEVFSAIIPLGEEVNGARVNIESVNNYKAYIENAEAVAKYGLIYKAMTFPGITDPQVLKLTATSFMQDNFMEASNIEITVADISALDPSLDSFMPGQWVNVNSKHHFPTNPNTFLVKKISIGVSDPTQTQIFIGRIKRGLTQALMP